MTLRELLFNLLLALLMWAALYEALILVAKVLR